MLLFFLLLIVVNGIVIVLLLLLFNVALVLLLLFLFFDVYYCFCIFVIIYPTRRDTLHTIIIAPISGVGEWGVGWLRGGKNLR